MKLNPKLKLSPKLKTCINGLLDIFYPRTCPISGEPSDRAEGYLSASALETISFIQEPFCQRCGSMFFGEITGPIKNCEHCDDFAPSLQQVRSLFRFGESGRKCIHLLKYHHGLYLLKDLEHLLKSKTDLLAFVAGAVLIPIPLHPRRRRTRGYNQSEHIAEALAKVAGGSVRVENLLQRRKDTLSQVGLKRHQRKNNLKGAFAMAKGKHCEAEQPYVLIDDVFTTGATLSAAAKALHKGGARNIRAFSLSRG